jgi:hypothetical protein
MRPWVLRMVLSVAKEEEEEEEEEGWRLEKDERMVLGEVVSVDRDDDAAVVVVGIDKRDIVSKENVVVIVVVVWRILRAVCRTKDKLVAA